MRTNSTRPTAGVGRKSPLRYTVSAIGPHISLLGLEENRRSGILGVKADERIYSLGLEENRRSGILSPSNGFISERWGWKKIAAQVYYI